MSGVQGSDCKNASETIQGSGKRCKMWAEEKKTLNQNNHAATIQCNNKQTEF